LAFCIIALSLATSGELGCDEGILMIIGGDDEEVQDMTGAGVKKAYLNLNSSGSWRRCEAR
jgi:hypothetical protein